MRAFLRQSQNGFGVATPIKAQLTQRNSVQNEDTRLIVVCLSICWSVSAMGAMGPAALLNSDFDDARCMVCKNLYEAVEMLHSRGVSMKDAQEVVLKINCSGVKICETYFKMLIEKMFEQMKEGKHADEGCQNIYGMCK